MSAQLVVELDEQRLGATHLHLTVATLQQLLAVEADANAALARGRVDQRRQRRQAAAGTAAPQHLHRPIALRLCRCPVARAGSVRRRR